jgi:hypothetical protein
VDEVELLDLQLEVEQQIILGEQFKLERMIYIIG